MASTNSKIPQFKLYFVQPLGGQQSPFYSLIIDLPTLSARWDFAGEITQELNCKHPCEQAENTKFAHYEKRRLIDQGGAAFIDESLQSLKKGSLKLELSGKKFKGGFVLVRTPHLASTPAANVGKTKKSWFFFKYEDRKSLERPRYVKGGTTLWPDTLITEHLLADYYQCISGFAGAFFKDRPVTLLRAPRGVTENLFYENFSGISLNSSVDFLKCGQIKAVELHVSAYKIRHLHYPDLLVLDFDPPLAGSARKLLRVASVANELLSDMGMKFIWKVSGHHGLHLLIPLKQMYSAVAVFDFAKMLAEMIFEQVPQISTIQQATHADKVFINYHRNHHYEKTIAPFSPRATIFPSISMPVEWSEISNSIKLPVFDFNTAEWKLKMSAELLDDVLQQENDLELGFVAFERTQRKAL